MDATTSPETLKAVRVGFARALPIMLGYAPVAFAFGVLATQSGMPIWLATATSILMFAGSGQFITISLWFAGAGLISTALAVFVTNLRYFLMAVALAPHVRPLKGLARLIYGWQITDELFAVHITAFQQGWELNKTAIFTATGCAQFAVQDQILDVVADIFQGTYFRVPGTVLLYDVVQAVLLAECLQSVYYIPQYPQIPVDDLLVVEQYTQVVFLRGQPFFL